MSWVNLIEKQGYVREIPVDIIVFQGKAPAILSRVASIEFWYFKNNRFEYKSCVKWNPECI